MNGTSENNDKVTVGTKFSTSELGEKEVAVAFELEMEPYVIQIPKKEKRKTSILGKGVLIAVAALAIVYLGGFAYFSCHFSWNTTLNGVDVAFMSAAKAQEKVEALDNSYQLEIRTRDGKTERIKGKDIDLEIRVLGSVEQEIKKQNAALWFLDGWNQNESQVEFQVTYDTSKLLTQIQKLDCMQSENIIEPEEPEIIHVGGTYTVTEGNMGQKPVSTMVQKAIQSSIANLEAYVDLEEANCYMDLNYNAADGTIMETLDFLNTLQEMKITYQFDGKEEILHGEEILEWVTVTEDYEISLDEARVEAYIETLKEAYEIRGQVIDFHTSYDATVEITSYIRSNELNTAVETEQLMQIIQEAMESGETEFVRDSEDMASVGDTYIEINLTSQYLYCYKDGKVILETDIVSGRPSTGCATPPGVYTIRSKTSPAILVGEDYRTPVSYWMPFNGGIGLHDATWQSAYGGQRYLSNGSHGCINLPLDAAKFIYENYGAGDVVVLYHLEGTARAEAVPAAVPKSSPIYVYVPPEEPSTEPPTSEPSTEPPTSEPATEAPVTESVTEAPATELPATENTTEAPATEVSTEPPSTDVSTEAPIL